MINIAMKVHDDGNAVEILDAFSSALDSMGYRECENCQCWFNCESDDVECCPECGEIIVDDIFDTSSLPHCESMNGRLVWNDGGWCFSMGSEFWDGKKHYYEYIDGMLVFDDGVSFAPPENWKMFGAK